MNIGKLDRLVSLRKLAPAAQNAYGELEPVSYVEVAKVSAQMLPATGAELYQAQQLTAVQPVTWLIRYRAELNTTWLLVYGETTYEITAMSEVGRRSGLTLTTHTRPAPAAPAVVRPVPEAPALVALENLDGRFQFPAGTTIDQLEIELS